MKLSSELERKLRSIRGRLVWNRRIRLLAAAACIAGGASFIYVLASRFVALRHAAPVAAYIIAGGLCLGLVISFLRRITAFHAALKADNARSLSELISTALHLTEMPRERQSGFAEAVIARANESARVLDPGRVEPLRFPAAAVALAAIAALTFALALIPPSHAVESGRDAAKTVFLQIQRDLGQAAAELDRSSRKKPAAAKIAEAVRQAEKLLAEKSDPAALRQLAKTLAEARGRLDERFAVIRHFETSRLLNDLAQNLKMGMPELSEAAADRLAGRLRANPREYLRQDAARTIRRLLEELKKDSEIRRSLAEAEAALENADVSAFENALSKLAKEFTPDLDERSVSLVEAVLRSAEAKLGEGAEGGILVGGAGISREAAQRSAPVAAAAAKTDATPALPVDAANIPARFRPVVEKYFAVNGKEYTIPENR